MAFLKKKKTHKKLRPLYLYSLIGYWVSQKFGNDLTLLYQFKVRRSSFFCMGLYDQRRFTLVYVHTIVFIFFGMEALDVRQNFKYNPPSSYISYYSSL